MFSSVEIAPLRAALAASAQTVLDGWQQDEQGWDEELGQGGACQDVANAMQEVLAANGIEDCLALFTEFDGGHVFLVVNLSDGVFTLDIAPSTYESGAGYVWRKREGVVLGPGDIHLSRIEPPMSPEAFRARYDENAPADDLAGASCF
ncbi:hypothetical protein LAZ40_07090 [Cereibacter sphaeroides]|uniref:hypothetical protein n=1 Tax=Cereibacter sphaeroides TaxID=1063 RepID=UPI001F2DD936|nr:hypothetical protein [Cereibacter sphaeroides]MCE6958813.1 hypothetical protein [Cereibacter sphaeroides]MCE6973313.1 hypothetical protein [Cereibacter sphaeroides]